MEPLMARTLGVHDHEHGPKNVGLHPEGEDEHRHDKKSVLKKVKDKAKKLKEKVNKTAAYSSASLTNSAHGQGGGLSDSRTYYGGPTTMQEEHSGTDPINSSVLRQEEDEVAPPKVLLERTTAIEEVPHAPVNSPADTVKGFVHEQERIRGQPEVNLEAPVGLEEDPHAPKDRLVDNAPSNYQTRSLIQLVLEGKRLE